MTCLRAVLAVGLLFPAGQALAALEPIDDPALGDAVGQQGLVVTLEGLELISRGLREKLDPDNPPNTITVSSANKLYLFGDSTADGVNLLDFWIFADRITTNPNAGSGAGEDGLLALTFKLDAGSRVGGDLNNNGVRDAGEVGYGDGVKREYLVMTIDPQTLKLGPGDRNDPENGTNRYWHIDGYDGAGASCTAASPVCAFRGYSLYQFAGNSFNGCVIGTAGCDGTIMQEINYWGDPQLTGNIVIYGRNPTY